MVTSCVACNLRSAAPCTVFRMRSTATVRCSTQTGSTMRLGALNTTVTVNRHCDRNALTTPPAERAGAVLRLQHAAAESRVPVVHGPFARCRLYTVLRAGMLRGASDSVACGRSRGTGAPLGERCRVHGCHHGLHGWRSRSRRCAGALASRAACAAWGAHVACCSLARLLLALGGMVWRHAHRAAAARVSGMR